MFRRLIAGFCAAAAVSAVATTAAVASGSVGFNHNWGGTGVIAGRHTESFCATHGISAGGHRRITWNRTLTKGIVHHYVGTVYCSDVFEVHHNTTGPGSDGISISCPSDQRPEHGAAGFHSNPQDALTQVHGGFGSNNDGYWNYKFHNWNPQHTAHVQMWAVCLDKHQPNLHGV